MVPLLFPLLSLIAGILAGAHLDPFSVWLCLPLALLIGIARRPLMLLAVFLAGAGLRGSVPAVPPNPGSEAVRLEARLNRAPEWRDSGVDIGIDVLSVDGRPYRGGARLTEFLDNPDQRQLFDDLGLCSGDRVEILVALRRPAVYRDPGVFDFREHLERQGIYWTGTIRNPRLITVMSRGWHGPDRLRAWIENRIRMRFEDENVGGLVLGMVLGRTAGISPEIERQFQAGGLFHLLVVSGFNLAVIASAASWLARRVIRRRRGRLILTLVCVLVYAFLAGWQTRVARAAIMACVFIVGRILDRGHSSLNAAALAAIVLLANDPAALEDSSFQMTFAAVVAFVAIGIPAAQWIFERLAARLHEFSDAQRDGHLLSSDADWRVSRRMWCEQYRMPFAIVTFPWRLVHLLGKAFIAALGVEAVFVYFMVESFHRISPISPFLNVPAGLLAAAITPLGLLLIVLPDVAAAPLAKVILIMVRVLLWTLHAGLAIPHASVRVPSAPSLLWAGYAIVLALVVWSVHRRQRVVFAAASLTAIGVLIVIARVDFSPPPPKDVVVTVLDVGQGDSILVEFPGGRRMLIDGGGVAAGRFMGLRDESTFSIGEDVVSAYLFSRGIRRLDTVVLTHAHNDHLDGLFDVTANFQIGEVWLGKSPMIPAFRAFIEQLGRRQIPIRWVSAGDKTGETTVLYPPASYKVRKTAQNNDSVVLLLDTGRQTALLTGDLEIAIPLPPFVNLLKVAHHGGASKLRVKSELPVISVGANNPFGHPTAAALPALRTDQMGAIQITLAGNRLEVAQPR